MTTPEPEFTSKYRDRILDLPGGEDKWVHAHNKMAYEAIFTQLVERGIPPHIACHLLTWAYAAAHSEFN